MLPGPGDLPGDGRIPSPLGAADEAIPLPPVQNNAAVANPGGVFTIPRHGNGGGAVGGQPAVSFVAATPAAGQGQNPAVVPPTAGPARFTGITPTQPIHPPMVTTNNATNTNATGTTVKYVTSGIRRAIGAINAAINDPATIRGELNWQRGASADSAGRTAFKAQLLSQMGFRCLGFMRPNSQHIQVVHSMANCFVPGGSAEFQNKDFGFVGDLSGMMSPQPVLMTKDKPWKVETKKVVMDAVAMDTHYRSATGEDVKKLWNPVDKSAAQNHTCPRMILIPSNLVEFLTTTPRTPWELYTHITGLIAATGSQWTDQDWKFIVEWCIMASQVDNPGSSWLAFEFDGGASGDPMFQQWCSDRLSLTLQVDKSQGSASAPSAANQAHQPIDMAQLGQVMSAAAGQAVGVAVAAMRQAAPAPAPTPTKADGIGKQYQGLDQATIKGFCGVKQLKDVANIWGYFQTTKSSKEHRNLIMRRMKKWASDHGFKIDPAIFFPLTFVEDIVALNLNPGECVAIFSSIDKGLTPMACRPRSAAAVEYIKSVERAKEASDGNRTFDEALKLSKSDPTTPPEGYEDLCRMFVGYTGLIYALWGESNDLYQSLFRIITMLESDPVQMVRLNFSKSLCAQATWALCEDVRQFFGDPLTPENFSGGQKLRFPVSNISDISTNLRHQEEFHRRSFPSAWLYTASGGLPQVSVMGSQYGGGSFIQPTFVQPPAAGQPASFVQQGTLTHPGSVTFPVADDRSVMSGLTSLPQPAGANPFQIKPPQAEVPRKMKGLNADVHPIISAVTMPYLQKRGKLQLSKVMKSAGVTWEQMPIIPKYMKGDGTNELCYNFTYGVCTGAGDGKACTRKHPQKGEVTDDFASTSMGLLHKGFEYLSLNHAPVGDKKRKAGGR